MFHLLQILTFIVIVASATNAFKPSSLKPVQVSKLNVGMQIDAVKSLKTAIISYTLAGILPYTSLKPVFAAEEYVKTALYTKKTNDLQPYADINRGFKLLRPFGFNEFEGAGKNKIAPMSA